MGQDSFACHAEKMVQQGGNRPCVPGGMLHGRHRAVALQGSQRCSCWVALSLPSPPSAPGPTFGTHIDIARLRMLEPKLLQALLRGCLEQGCCYVPFFLQPDGVIVREAWRQRHTSCS